MHNHSDLTTIEIFAYAVVWMIAKAKSLKKHGENCNVIVPKTTKGVEGWLDDQAISVEKGKVVLFKRVSKDFKTREGNPNETDWKIGKTLEHSAWSPKDEECGPGKFHACSRPYFCDEFRSVAGDRYIAIEVDVKDLYAWEAPKYPHKIAFRCCVVLHECDKWSNRLLDTP